MRRPGTIPLLAALACFAVFFGNVGLGAAGGAAPLGNLAEMLLLLASSGLFVWGILLREGAEAPKRKSP